MVKAVNPAEQLHQHVAEVADFLKNLANENRMMVLCVLLGGELSVGQINEHIDLSPSALSQHLAWLRKARLVSTRRESQTIFYKLADKRVTQIMALLKKLFCD